VDTFEEEEEVDIKTVHDNIQSLKQQLSEVEAQMEKYLTELKLI
jgi:type I restriction enzyme M protein